MDNKEQADIIETALMAAGCFWCLEAQFQHLNGVISIEPGFTGGHTQNPSYEQVCTGETGHAETCRIKFDSSVISYQELLWAFFKAHDPTQLNRQGNDVGTQYRSALFYLNEDQRKTIETSLAFLKERKVFAKPIVTQVSRAEEFFPAENYHREYFNHHPENPYCSLVVAPKVKHFLQSLQESSRSKNISETK